MRPTRAFLAVVVAAVQLLAAARAATLPYMSVSGFVWAENMAFDGQGNLFVSDATEGTIYRVYLPANGTDYVKEVHIDGFSNSLGLAATPDGQTVYAVTRTSLLGSSSVIAFSTTEPNQYKTVVETLPASGNGLALHHRTGKLYSCSEGNFIPGQGVLMEINPDTGNASVLLSSFTALDGAYIDQNRDLLYFSDVRNATIYVMNLTDYRIISAFAPAGIQTIDDFCLSDDGTMFYGADFLGGQAFSCTVRGENVAILGSFTSPTSVRKSTGPGFDSTLLYVSEGGGLFKFQDSRRVLQVSPQKTNLH